MLIVDPRLGGYGNAVQEVDGNANIRIKVTGSPAYAVIAFCYLLIIVYALTLAPVCWVYAAEVCKDVVLCIPEARLTFRLRYGR